MHEQARTGVRGARRADPTWRRLLTWHDSRPRATFDTSRGWVWAAVVAASFFWMSNPLVYVRLFDDSLGYTITWTALAAVLFLPWLRVPRVPWPWALFLGLCAASLLWTIDATSTRGATVMYLELTVVALVVAANCEPEVVAWGMGVGGVVVVGLSMWAFEHTMWGSSYMTDFHIVFAGVGTNENILAYTLAVSLSAVLALGRPRALVPLSGWLAVLVVHAYGLYLASSGTGYLAALSLVVTVVLVSAWRRLLGVGRLVLLACAACLAAMSVAAVLVVTVVLDKDLSTLSGRAPFWRATVAATWDQAPVLGSGWGAVWARPWTPAPPNAVADDIYARAGYPLPHGHNFFLDVLPELGITGVVLALALVLYALRAVGSCGVTGESARATSGRLVLLVVVSLVVSGVSEPMLTVPLGWWSLTVVVALTRQGRTPRPAARAGTRPGPHRPPASPPAVHVTSPRHR